MKASMLRLIAIGCGQVFERYHLPAIRKCLTVQLVGLCDVDNRRRLWSQQVLPGIPFASSIEELLLSAKADAALISTPPEVHAVLIESALRAHLGLLVEKPMTLTLEEARRVRDVWRQSDRVVRVGFNRRYRRDYRRVQTRTAGHVEHVAYTFVADARRWQGGAKAVTTQFVLHDAGSHAVDLIAHIGGAAIARIRARTTHVGDHCIVRLQAVLGNGAEATCSVGHGSRYREELTVTAEGRVYRVSEPASPLREAKLVLHKITGTPTPNQDSFRSQLAGFVAACRAASDDIGADVTDGLASVSAINAALRSLDSGGAWQELAG